MCLCSVKLKDETMTRSSSHALERKKIDLAESLLIFEKFLSLGFLVEKSRVRFSDIGGNQKSLDVSVGVYHFAII